MSFTSDCVSGQLTLKELYENLFFILRGPLTGEQKKTEKKLGKIFVVQEEWIDLKEKSKIPVRRTRLM